MIIHNIKYFFKVLIKEKEVLFWAFLFPIILSIFFYMTMSNIQNANFMEPVNIGIYNESFDFRNSNEKNKTFDDERKKENKEILKDINKDEEETKKEYEEMFKNKLNENIKENPIQIDQNKAWKDIFSERYNKKEILLNVLDEMGYLKKYLPQNELNEETLKKLLEEQKNKNEEYKKFRAKKKEAGIKESEKRIFNIYYVEKEEDLDKLIEKGIVLGKLTFKDQIPNIVFKSKGLYETVAKSVLEEIYEKINTIEILLMQKIENLEKDIKLGIQKGIYPNKENIEKRIYFEVKEIINQIIDSKSNIIEIGKETPELANTYYYALIAMAFLYQSIFIIYIAENMIPNRKARSARVSMGIVPKIKLIIAAIVVSIFFQIIGSVILILFLKYIINFNFTLKLINLILIILVSALFASSFGLLIVSTINQDSDKLQSIAIMIIMLMCMFAGLMSDGLKYTIDKNAPIVNKLNPAALISDAFNGASVGNIERMKSSLIILLIMTPIFYIISFIFVSRKKADKI